jgi:RNA polymerase sigma-70 factor, ECF subfamily
MTENQDTPAFNQKLDDFVLAKMAQEGDRSAFELLVRRHQKKILNTCFRVVGYSEDAREIAADTFAEAFRAIQQFRAQAKFGTWLYRIALNLSFQHLKKKAHARKLIVNSEGEALETLMTEAVSHNTNVSSEALEWEETLGTIRLVLGKLSKAHAEILVLCDIEGLPYAEVSRLLNCPAGTVMSRLSRARDSFRKIWNELADD